METREAAEAAVGPELVAVSGCEQRELGERRKAMEQGSSELVRKANGKSGAVVTARDRHLLAFLAQGRLLTTKQVADLVFPGRHVTAARRRLRALEAGAAGKARYVRQLKHQTLDGRVVVTWAPAEAGFVLAEQLLGAVPRPVQDVSPEFREHLGLLNELFVRLVLAAQAGTRARPLAFARATGLPFRWNSVESCRLPWMEYDTKRGARRPRVIYPDAVVELPAQSKRVFIECEMGTHSISSADEGKTGATLAKVRRYDEFLHSTEDLFAKKTFYANAFPDGFAAEVLFLVPDEGRGRAIEKAIAKWGASQGQMPKVRVHTVDGAVRAFLPMAESPRSAKREPGAFTFTSEDLEVFRSAYGELNTFVEEARRTSAGAPGAVLPTRALRRMAALLARAADGGQRHSNFPVRAEGSP